MSAVPQEQVGVTRRGAGVPIVQALFWRADSPLDASGAVCFETLASGLAQSPYDGRHPFYSRAQHAVIVSEAVERLARLNPMERRVLAMHAWLADARASWLNGADPKNGKRRAVLRTADVEALAAVLAGEYRWSALPRGVADAPAGAVAVAGVLAQLAGFEGEDGRRLALYGLVTETAAAGLGTDAAEAALRAAGLDPWAPKAWGECLRFVRRMAAATVRRDCRTGAALDREAFPALKQRIEPLPVEPAARRWLQRYRTLTARRTRTHERSSDTNGGRA